MAEHVYVESTAGTAPFTFIPRGAVGGGEKEKEKEEEEEEEEEEEGLIGSLSTEALNSLRTRIAALRSYETAYYDGNVGMRSNV